MRIHTSLRTILTALFMIIAILPVLGIGGIALHSLSRSMETEIKDKNYLLATSLASELERFLNDPRTLLNHIRDVTEMRQIVTPGELGSYLDSLISDYDFFEVIKILNEDGAVTHLAPFDENMHGISIAFQEYYRAARKENRAHWSKTFISPQTGQPTLTLSMPLTAGMIVGHLDLSDLSKITERVRIGSHGYAAIIDKDGTVIAYSNRAYVLERVNFKNLLPVQQGVLGNEGTFRYGVGGEEKLGSVAIVPQTNWMVMVIQPVAEAFAPVRRVSTIIYAGTLIAILFALIISFLSLRKTLKPLFQLTEDTRRVAGGEYDFYFRSTGFREIDDLRNSFRIMADAVRFREEALQKAHDRLEHRVEARTAELRKAKEEAEIANRAKSRFLANMSHEIRTPMNAILGFTEIMKDRVSNPQISRYLHLIESGGKTLLNLINDILDLSRVEAGKLKTEYTCFSPHRLCNEMRPLFEQIINEKGLAFETDIPPDLPRALLLDETRLRQILINLIGNAVKFTESGHIRLSARHRYPDPRHRSSTDLIFSVEDTGVGIPEEQQEIIFDAFTQLRADERARHSGTGLGLTITRRLVEMMNGTITLRSRVGSGSRFTVVLRAVEVASADTSDSAQPETADLAAIAFGPGTVLIVDDISYNRELIRGYLEAYDLRLIEAENGIGAIEQAKRHQPQLILMDMRMPEMDGYEAVAILKKDERLKKTPVIAVTASAMKGDEEVIGRLCDAYLPKPVSKTALITEIMKFLPHRIIRDESPEDAQRQALSDGFSFRGLADYPQLSEIIKSRGDDCDRLMTQMAVYKIEDFGKEMKELGRQFGFMPLANWGDALYSSAVIFDIEQVRNLLSIFQKLTGQSG